MYLFLYLRYCRKQVFYDLIPLRVHLYSLQNIFHYFDLDNYEKNFTNTYFDITDHVSKKMQALKVYDNEMRSHPHPRSYDNCDRLSFTAGAESGVDRAERFMLLREVL